MDSKLRKEMIEWIKSELNSLSNEKLGDIGEIIEGDC